MEQTQIYGGGLTAEQFLFPEMRIAARLWLGGCDMETALARIQGENLFQYPTEREIGRIAKACYKRLEALGQRELVEELAHGPAADAKQIDLYAMMRYNALVWDFMTQVIGEKFRCRDLSFSRRDLNAFFTDLQSQNDTVAAWSDATIGKIKSVLVKVLVETEYLDSVRDTTLHPVLLGEVLEEGIRQNGDQEALAAFCCF